MFRRLLTVGLALAVALAGRAAAKPPDLPLPGNDVLAPAAPAERSRTARRDLFAPEAAPAPETLLFFRVRPSARRTVASCLLFGANPLLALAPTREVVDFDEDDAPSSFFDFFGALIFDEGNATGSQWFGGVSISEHPAPEWSSKWTAPDAALALASDDSPESSPCRPFPGRPAGPDEPMSECPYMNRCSGAESRRLFLSADVDLSHDVLDNLEMLRQAQELLQDAREFGRAGGTWEAVECLLLAQDLCPSARLEEKVAEASAEILGAVLVGEARAEYDAEPIGPDPSIRPCLPPVDPQLSAELDALYSEIATAGEPAEVVVKGESKPFAKSAELEDVGCGKGDGAVVPASYEAAPESADFPETPVNPPDEDPAD